MKRPVDVIVIPCQWRARDIAEEMARAGIRCHSVLIPHQGRLFDFHGGEHPYGSRSGVNLDAAAELLTVAG